MEFKICVRRFREHLLIDEYDNNGHSDHKVEDYSDSDLDDIDNERANNDENVYASSVGNPSRGIVIRNELGAHMSIVDPDAAHASEFLEYPDILSVHRLTTDPKRELFVGQKFATKEDYVFAIVESKNIKSWEFFLMNLRMYVLALQAGNLDAKNEAETSKSNGGRTRFCREVTEFSDCRPDILPRPYRVDLRNKRCYYEKFQTLCYLCTHVVTACARVRINAEQYIDEVYTLERTLHIWENEFPVLHDLSTWKMSSLTFELVPNNGLRRESKGRPHVTRIHGEMDMKEKSDPKICGLCRTIVHNQTKCLHRTCHIRQPSRSSGI
ncbi:hypothetical protein GOBAR_DD17916 [Gossypium barbadense]|nr:hypothetical protein GOBAR_DD17916 [Gossypium barbadense]